MFRPHNSHKLITKEDPLYFHKLLGIICLANYAYRYYLLIRHGSMDLNNRNAAILVLCHATLSCSSLVFHIPATRNKGAPMIYPEYRLHSILFVLRSVVCYFLTFFDYSIEYKFAACYATMLLADFVTAMYILPTNRIFVRESSNTFRCESSVIHKLPETSINTTMRNMPFDKRIEEDEQKQIILMQSSQQIGATLYMFGNLDSCFSPMFAIQIAAFLMTMVRKSIIDSNMWHLVYNIALWMNVLCFYSLPIGYLCAEVILFQVFYYWRFSNMNNLPQLIVGNKYIGWTMVFTTLYYYRIMRFDEKVSVFILQNNMDMYIRLLTIFGYLTTQMYKSKGLLVAFLPKT